MISLLLSSATALSPLFAPTPNDLAPSIRDAFSLQDGRVASVQWQEGLVGDSAVAVSVGNQSIVLNLRHQSVRASGFQVLEQDENGIFTPVAPEPVSTYRGSVSGVDGSRVAASRGEHGVTARIFLSNGEEFWIEPIATRLSSARPGQHVLFSADAVQAGGEICGTDLLPVARPVPVDLDKKSTGGWEMIQTAEIGCDADFEYFQDYGSTGGVQNRIESIINTINLQYESEVGITHAITSILVRTSSNQPYTSTDAVTLLNQFRDEWNANQGGIQRDVAQLFTGKEINGGTIGIAWIGVVCNLSFGYSMVQSDFNNNSSCAADLSAHEFGHNWNADHCNCTSNTMNPFITCANTFHPTFTIPDIVAFRDSRNCLDGGSGGDPTSVHVASVAPTTQSLGKGRKAGRVTVVIEDDTGAAVSGANVTVTFSGAFNETASGTTGANGSVTITTNGSKKGKAKFTVCVDSVSASLPYEPGDNAETCDSN